MPETDGCSRSCTLLSPFLARRSRRAVRWLELNDVSACWMRQAVDPDSEGRLAIRLQVSARGRPSPGRCDRVAKYGREAPQQTMNGAARPSKRRETAGTAGTGTARNSGAKFASGTNGLTKAC